MDRRRKYDLTTSVQRESVHTYFQLARHSSNADQNGIFDEPFQLIVQMLEECTMAEFQVRALAFHDRLSAYHAQSAVGRTNPKLPASALVHAFHHSRDAPQSCIFSKMDFSTSDLAPVVYFGRFRPDIGGVYNVLACYRNGQEVQDIAVFHQLVRLLRDAEA
jgi:hypothetical protein